MSEVSTKPPPQPTIDLRKSLEQRMTMSLFCGTVAREGSKNALVAQLQSPNYLNDPELGRVAALMKVVKSPVFDLKSTSMELSLRKD